jgi:hypothetical protein
MTNLRSLYTTLAVALVFATGCADQTAITPVPTGPETTLAEAPSSACRLQTLSRDARDYFPQPEIREARDLISLIGDACNAGDQALVTTHAWAAIRLVEAVVDAGRGGSPAAGASFVNGLVDCIEALCAPDDGNDLALGAALSATGLFAVRGDDQVPALSRAPVAFTDFGGNANRARWGLEVSQNKSWSYVTGTTPVLLYGAPLVTGGTPVQDISFGDLQFDMNRYPIPAEGQPGHRYRDDALHVGLCFESEVPLPHIDGDEDKPVLEPRMQREAVLLETRSPSFCDQAFLEMQSASLLGSLGTLLARPILALFVTDRLAPSLGGTPLEFSRFAPVAADVRGSLEFVTQPTSVVVEGEPIGVIEVRARSGAGTPMEKVRITLSIRANQGVPAGAVISGDTVSLTDEDRGIATFPDGDGVAPSVGKPGGYLLCANGELAGFTFPEICSDQFHVRNSQGD